LSQTDPRSLSGPGTAESYWARSGRLDLMPRWEPGRPASGRVVVVAPHPDDEILGVGGTLRRLAEQVTITVVAVTDGEASYPGREDEMRRCRPAETAAAFEALGVAPEAVVRLGVPDGRVTEGVAFRLAEHIGAGDLVLAPWVGDGHPDHDATGMAARHAASARGAVAMAYLVWAWHWAGVDDIPWADAVRVDLGAETAQRKRRAVACFTSQVGGPEPVLPPAVLARLTRDFEILLRP
jgi:LmbE family N-acetylglucosaminyl deacetylase